MSFYKSSEAQTSFQQANKLLRNDNKIRKTTTICNILLVTKNRRPNVKKNEISRVLVVPRQNERDFQTSTEGLIEHET